jgi:hypothetical protein
MSIKHFLPWVRLQDQGDIDAAVELNQGHEGHHHDHHMLSPADSFSRRRFIRTAAGAAGAAGLVLGSSLSTPVLGDRDEENERDGRNKCVDDRDGDADDAASPSPIPGGLPLLAPISPEVFHFFFPGPGVEPSLITDFRGSIGLASAHGTGTGEDTNTGQMTQLFFGADVRFMKGEYVGMCDRERHTGAFAFI